MDILRVEHQESTDAAVSRITKSFEEKIAKQIEERDAALLSAKSWRGKNFGRKSERNAGNGKETKKSQKNIINKTAGNQRLTVVCGKVDAYT